MAGSADNVVNLVVDLAVVEKIWWAVPCGYFFRFVLKGRICCEKSICLQESCEVGAVGVTFAIFFSVCTHKIFCGGLFCAKFGVEVAGDKKDGGSAVGIVYFLEV